MCWASLRVAMMEENVVVMMAVDGEWLGGSSSWGGGNAGGCLSLQAPN